MRWYQAFVLIATVCIAFSLKGVASADVECDTDAYRWSCVDLYRIMECESGFEPWVENHGSIGLMQIHLPSHWDKLAWVAGRDWHSYADAMYEGPELLKDPAINLAVAYMTWLGSRWGPWSCK